MPRLTPKGRYLCSKDDLETLLRDTCTVVLERVGVPLNEPEEAMLDREILAALAYLDRCIAQQVQLPIICPEDI